LPAVNLKTGLWTAKFLRDRLSSEQSRSRRTHRSYSLVLVQVPASPLASLPYQRQLTVLRGLGHQFVAGGVVDHLVHVPDETRHWFAVILPDTDRSGAQVIERRLRLGIGGYLSSRGLRLGELESASLTAPDDDPAMAEVWDALLGPDDADDSKLDDDHKREQEQVPAPRFRRAADDGDTEAMNNLGRLLAARGEAAEAETWFRRAADAGNTDAMNNLADLLATRGDRDEAGAWYQHAAHASRLETERTREHEQAEELARVRRAADDGDTDAMNHLGALLAERNERAEAQHWFLLAADAGNADAMNNLGRLLAERGDLAEAETWYRRGADNGIAFAMNNLALLLEHQGDLAEAETWYRRAADAGDTEAMNNLAVLLGNLGDRTEAAAWFRLAADAGNPSAMNNLGLLLERQGDRAEAAAWFRLAADAGHAGARYNLGAPIEQDAGPPVEQAHYKDDQSKQDHTN
jgi:TPR repeat protein